MTMLKIYSIKKFKHAIVDMIMHAARITNVCSFICNNLLSKHFPLIKICLNNQNIPETTCR